MDTLELDHLPYPDDDQSLLQGRHGRVTITLLVLKAWSSDYSRLMFGESRPLPPETISRRLGLIFGSPMLSPTRVIPLVLLRNTCRYKHKMTDVSTSYSPERAAELKENIQSVQAEIDEAYGSGVGPSKVSLFQSMPRPA